MGAIISMLPKGLLAFLVIAGGMAFVILADPPHTVCESQLDLFREAQKRFLFIDKRNKRTPQPPKYALLVDTCKQTNSPGGCYELFEETRRMLRDMDAVPTECNGAAGRIDEVKKALYEMPELLIRLAWGEKPPATYNQKFGWLEAADVSLFCALKKEMSETYGQDAYEVFREKMFTKLPGAENMGRGEVWDMSILSENCARYP